MIPEYRRGQAADLALVEQIQRAAPEAAHWNPGDYLEHEFWVAVVQGGVAGFLVLRHLAPGEGEILNLAVAPEFRHQHLATGLFRAALGQFQGALYLEVRDSNQTARRFYKSLGFQEVSVRRDYYSNPPEAAIVMKFHSC